jgi:hypothetical protein
MIELGLQSLDGSSKHSPVTTRLCIGKAAGPDGILDYHIHNNQNIRDNIYQYVSDIFNARS